MPSGVLIDRAGYRVDSLRSEAHVRNRSAGYRISDFCFEARSATRWRRASEWKSEGNQVGRRIETRAWISDEVRLSNAGVRSFWRQDRHVFNDPFQVAILITHRQNKVAGQLNSAPMMCSSWKPSLVPAVMALRSDADTVMPLVSPPAASVPLSR